MEGTVSPPLVLSFYFLYFQFRERDRLPPREPFLYLPLSPCSVEGTVSLNSPCTFLFLSLSSSSVDGTVSLPLVRSSSFLSLPVQWNGRTDLSSSFPSVLHIPSSLFQFSEGTVSLPPVLSSSFFSLPVQWRGQSPSPSTFLFLPLSSSSVEGLVSLSLVLSSSFLSLLVQ